jgi:hypothetical protein
VLKVATVHLICSEWLERLQSIIGDLYKASRMHLVMAVSVTDRFADNRRIILSYQFSKDEFEFGKSRSNLKLHRRGFEVDRESVANVHKKCKRQIGSKFHANSLPPAHFW